MKITDKQLISMLFLLSWTISETQARPLAYNTSSATEAARPRVDYLYEPPLEPPRHREELTPLLLTGLGVASFLFGFLFFAIVLVVRHTRCGLIPSQEERGRPFTPGYNHANNPPLPDIELQALPSVEAGQPLSAEIVEDEAVDRLLANGM